MSQCPPKRIVFEVAVVQLELILLDYGCVSMTRDHIDRSDAIHCPNLELMNEHAAPDKVS